MTGSGTTDIRPLLLYIHGFNSSPKSYKARVLGKYMEEQLIPGEYQVPELGQWPGENSRVLLEMASEALKTRPIYIIGSSLGGYYGTWLMQTLLALKPDFPVKMVLVNPAVNPCDPV